MKQVWNILGGMANIERLELEAWRLIEDQFRSSTRKMVDNVEEHEILEQLIEGNKPKVKFYGDEQAFKGLHYLLYTPFRYPPLKRGSRFGKRTERNLFYSSFELETTLYEKAFYRLNFLLASEGNVGGKTIKYTAFKVSVNTNKGIDLSKQPFIQYRGQISSPSSYHESQVLGSCMREEGVEAFISYSARSKNNGKNLNIFTPMVFRKTQLIEKTFQTFECYSTKEVVEFYSNLNSIKSPMIFNTETFSVKGAFPKVEEF